MEQITIAGRVFNAPLRYEEGHELTANEAAALNQTFHENLRNNFAKKVKEANDANAFDSDAFQTQFDEYAKSYQFGVRTGGGGGPRDPVMTEAMGIARDRLKNGIRAKGRKVSDYTSEAISNAAKALIDKYPDILELAKKRVEEARAAASVDLEGLIDQLAAE